LIGTVPGGYNAMKELLNLKWEFHCALGVGRPGMILLPLEKILRSSGMIAKGMNLQIQEARGDRLHAGRASYKLGHG